MERKGWGQAGPSRNLPMEELKDLLLDKAVEMLGPTGLTVSLEHLNLEELIRAAGVPRSSVYRAFGNKEAFFLQLMIKLVEPTETSGAAYDPGTAEVAQATAMKYQDRLGNASGQRAVAREMVRLAAKRNFDAICASVTWKTYIALSATLDSLEPSSRAPLLEALSKAESSFIEKMSHLYEQLMPIVGLTFRDGFTSRHLAAAGAAIVEGLAQRRPVNADVVDTPILLPGIDGDPVEWHLAAVGFLAALDQMTIMVK